MLKPILTVSVFLLVFSTSGFAREATNTTNEIPASQSTKISSTKNFPVILQNEMISSGLCRLHLDNGTKLEVSCTKTKKEESV